MRPVARVNPRSARDTLIVAIAVVHGMKLAGDVDGIPGRCEEDELEHVPLGHLRHLRDREPSLVRDFRHQPPTPPETVTIATVVGRQHPDDAT